MPSGIVRCARALGLDGEVIANKTWAVRFLKLGYGDELTALRDLGVLTETRHSHSVRTPKAGERELKVLAERPGIKRLFKIIRGTEALMMHYIMVRPDSTIMEPGAGTSGTNMATVKSSVSMHGTGLSVFIKKP